MGQYHIINAPELKQAIYPFDVDSGLKALEQVWSWGPRATFTLLMASGFGETPRSLNWAQGVGAWAGRRVSAAGDYAEDTDMLNAPAYLEDDSCKDSGAPVNKTSKRKTNRSVSAHFIPVLERVANRRRSDVGVSGVSPAKEGYSFWSFVDVSKSSNGWEIASKDQEVRDYYERIATKTPDGKFICEREPIALEGAPDSLPEDSLNTPGLWVNLDRMEYVDAAAFGETDLVETVNGLSGAAIMTMLFHHEPRGGGDINGFQAFNIIGRWRGDRIALIGPEGLKKRWAKIDPDTVRSTYTNITELAQIFINSDILTKGRSIETFDGEDMIPSQSVKSEISKALLKDETIRSLFLELKEAFYIHICGPAMLTMGAETYEVAPSVRVHTSGGGRLWIPTEVEIRFQEALKNMKPVQLTLNSNNQVVMNNTAEFDLANTSAHAILQEIS